MRTFILLSSSLLIFASCSKNEPQTKTPVATSYNGAEGDEWAGTYLIKISENAHSGKAVAFINSSDVFSLQYLKSLENISKTKIDSVVFSYWMFFRNEKASAKTVISIDKPDNTKNLLWVGNPVEQKVKEYNKWIYISETFKVPSGLDPKSIVKLYVLNTSKEEILLDDMKVNFY